MIASLDSFPACESFLFFRLVCALFWLFLPLWLNICRLAGFCLGGSYDLSVVQRFWVAGLCSCFFVLLSRVGFASNAQYLSAIPGLIGFR